MYQGQVAVVTNREDWVSDFIQLVDEDTGEILNILNPDIGFDAAVYIADEDRCRRKMISLNDGTGQVVATAGDDGPGIQWTFKEADLQGLCSGTYTCGLKITANDIVTDAIVGTLAVVEGNR